MGGLWHVPSCVLCPDHSSFPDTDQEGAGWYGANLCQDTCTEVVCTPIYTFRNIDESFVSPVDHPQLQRTQMGGKGP